MPAQIVESNQRAAAVPRHGTVSGQYSKECPMVGAASLKCLGNVHGIAQKQMLEALLDKPSSMQAEERCLKICDMVIINMKGIQ